MIRRRSVVAALVSGGIESAALLAHLSKTRGVQPIYVRGGHAWEPAELYWLHRLIRSLRKSNVLSLAILDIPVADAYRHSGWSLSGRGVPASTTPDEAVYLPGRNILLLSKAAVFCSERGIRSIAIGTLGSNPFPDASPGFHRRFAAVLSEGLGKKFSVERPFGRMHKEDVLRRVRDVPWRLTFSCIHPKGRIHCGRCNKCAERRTAFLTAGMADPTRYMR